MEKNKKFYFVKSSDGTENYVKAENEKDAVEKVKEYYRKHLNDDKELENINFDVKERKEITTDNFEAAMIQYNLDKAVDDTLESVKYLIRNMTMLAEKLEFSRELGCYNENGEIQGAASSIEVGIGKLTALQKVKDLLIK